MKHKLLKILLLSPAVLFHSCTSSDEPESAEIIKFSSPLVIREDGSRATLVMSALPSGSRYCVYGYCIPLKNSNGGNADENYDPHGASNEWNAKKGMLTPDVIDGATLRVDNLGSYYIGTPAQWYTPGNPRVRKEADPVDFKYSFIAVAPAGENFSVVHPEVGAPTVSYKVKYPCEEDAMYAFLTDHKREWGAVDLQFHHILSALSVKFNNYNRYEDIVINELKLDGSFYNEASINFADAVPTVRVTDNALSSCTMNFVTEPVTVVKEAAAMAPDIFFVLANSHGSEANYLGSSKVISGSYTYKGERIDFRIPKEGSNFNFGRVPLPGVNYTLNINFLGNDILLMLSADDVEYWEIGSNSTTIIE